MNIVVQFPNFDYNNAKFLPQKNYLKKKKNQTLILIVSWSVGSFSWFSCTSGVGGRFTDGLLFLKKEKKKKIVSLDQEIHEISK